MLRWSARRRLGRALVITIDPATVERHLDINQPLSWRLVRYLRAQPDNRWFRHTKPFVSRILYSSEPFFLSPSLLRRAIPIEQDSRYRLLHDLIVTSESDPARSRWYAEACDDLERHGVYRHKEAVCRSEQEISEMLSSRVMGMVRSIKETGYDPARTTDIGSAFVDRDGRVVKSDAGNHRFASARIVGTRAVPVEILGVDRRWYEDQRRRNAGLSRLDALRRGLAEVETEHSAV